VLAETAMLADTAAFRASAPRYLNTVDGADVEDWGAMLIVFDDGTVAQIAASDAVLGGIRNQLAVYAAKAVVLCNINPNDAVQAYAPDAQLFAAEYITEKIETKAGWTFPAAGRGLDDRLPRGDAGLHRGRRFDREPLSGGPLARDVTAVLYGRTCRRGGPPRDLRPFI
jgi:hypothetical protein